jgi:hypothetical protein
MCLIACNEAPRLWPDGEIPFIPIGFDAEHLLQLEKNMTAWEFASCGRVKFINKLIYTNYDNKDNIGDLIIYYYGDSSKESYSGGYGYNIDSFIVFNMTNDMIMLHELGHIIGLYHEHQRPDRDLYIKLCLDGKPLLHVWQFVYLIPETYDYQKYPYDLKSIMHYSRNGSQGIITYPEDCGGETISPIDALKVYDMYSPNRLD